MSVLVGLIQRSGHDGRRKDKTMKVQTSDDFDATRPAGGAVMWIAIFSYFAVCGILLAMN